MRLTYHQGALLHAWSVEKGATRVFALSGIHSWTPVP